MMGNYSNEFLERTIRVWQPYSNKPLTIEDAREIVNCMVEFITYLTELEKKYSGESPGNPDFSSRDTEP